MNRRTFLTYSALGAVSFDPLNAKEYLRFLEDSALEPYEFNINDPDFQNTLKNNSLPRTVRIKSKRQTPNKSSWSIGEGRSSGTDSRFQGAVSRHNRKVNDFYRIAGAYTPVVLLETAHHIIFGQFVTNDYGNFTYGVIRGFDEQFYVVHPIMRRVFTYQYNCYGLPTADFEELTCSRCNEKYVRQYFQTSCDAQTVALYGWMQCPEGGVHRGIPQLQYFKACGIADDGIDIGADF